MARSISRWGIHGSKNVPSRTSPHSSRRSLVAPRRSVPRNTPRRGPMLEVTHSASDLFNSRLSGNGLNGSFETDAEILDRAEPAAVVQHPCASSECCIRRPWQRVCLWRGLIVRSRLPARFGTFPWFRGFGRVIPPESVRRNQWPCRKGRSFSDCVCEELSVRRGIVTGTFC
jgi:hypothetical protein